FLRPDECPPCLDVKVPLRRRPMDQVEIDVFQLKPVQTRLERPQCHIETLGVAPHLCRDEDFVSRYARRTNTLTDSFLILISGRRINMPIPYLKCRSHGRSYDIVRSQVDTQSNLGDRVAVIKGNPREIGHAWFFGAGEALEGFPT